jgi:serine/threonine protein kinase
MEPSPGPPPSGHSTSTPPSTPPLKKEHSSGALGIKKENSRDKTVQVASAIPRRLSSHFDPRGQLSPPPIKGTGKLPVPGLSPEKMLLADQARDGAASPTSGRLPRRTSNSGRVPSPHTIIRNQNPGSAGVSPRYIDRIWDSLIAIDPNFNISPRTLTISMMESNQTIVGKSPRAKQMVESGKMLSPRNMISILSGETGLPVSSFLATRDKKVIIPEKIHKTKGSLKKFFRAVEISCDATSSDKAQSHVVIKGYLETRLRVDNPDQEKYRILIKREVDLSKKLTGRGFAHIERFLEEVVVHISSGEGGRIVEMSSLECGKEQGVKMLVQRLVVPCFDCDLWELLSKEKTLNERAFAQFILDLAHFIKRMHDLKIVHRDIKTENILLKFGENVCAALCDLGNACELSERSLLGMTGGTITNWDPAMVRFTFYEEEETATEGESKPKPKAHYFFGDYNTQKTYLPAIDIWSLGCIIWHVHKGEEAPWVAGLDRVQNSMANARNIKSSKNKILDLLHTFEILPQRDAEACRLACDELRKAQKLFLQKFAATHAINSSFINMLEKYDTSHLAVPKAKPESQLPPVSPPLLPSTHPLQPSPAMEFNTHPFLRNFHNMENTKGEYLFRDLKQLSALFEVEETIFEEELRQGLEEFEVEIEKWEKVKEPSLERNPIDHLIWHCLRTDFKTRFTAADVLKWALAYGGKFNLT